MFVGNEVLLDIGFTAAQASLARLARGGALLSASREAYGKGTTMLIRVGPRGPAPGMSRLVEVQFRELVKHEASALLTLRWEATGPGGALFPALDADLTLTPQGEQATVLALAGVYRPPLGALGAVLDRTVLSRVAEATIRAFVRSVAAAMTPPEDSAEPDRGVAG